MILSLTDLAGGITVGNGVFPGNLDFALTEVTAIAPVILLPCFGDIDGNVFALGGEDAVEPQCAVTC